MALYKNGKKIDTLFIGGSRINSAYKNGEKIYEFVPSIRNVNVAASANGGLASASSYLATSSIISYPASNANDNNKTSTWQAKNSPTATSPEWLQITFSNRYKINTITVTFTGGGVANDFKVQYFSLNNSWVDITSGSGNSSTSWNKTFTTVETTAIRIIVTKSDGSIGPRIADIDVRYVK